MTVSNEWLRSVMEGPEQQVEFKEAKSNYDIDKLIDYCVAIGNEGGGHLVLGVTNKRPRKIVGSRAYRHPGKIERKVLDVIHQRIRVVPLPTEEGRVVVVTIPARPRGTPLHHNGRYLTRADDSVVPMTPAQLEAIFAETTTDFSSEICPGVHHSDLEKEAVRQFRLGWARKTDQEDRKSQILSQPSHRLLEDAELMVDGAVTYAALILLGKGRALSQRLPQAEVVFEYRSSFSPGPAQQRINFRRGFLSFHDELWNAIDNRNDNQHFQEGMFVWDIPTFNERVIREAIANAVSHRAYRHAGSTFIRQYPRMLQVENPGGFPEGVTTDNFLVRNVPRNRRIAENLARCGVVERAGQGIGLMFKNSILEGKSEPDFAGTDAHHVSVRLDGQIENPKFIEFVEEVSKELGSTLRVEDLIIASRAYRAKPIGEELQARVPKLIEAGIIERAGGARSRKIMLSERFYRHLGEPGAYTRKRGLGKAAEKELLAKHLRTAGGRGAKVEELAQVLPNRPRRYISRLMQELKEEERVVVEGRTRAGRWYLKRQSGNNGGG